MTEIQEVEINDWKDIYNLGEEHDLYLGVRQAGNNQAGSDYIFRGQRDQSWPVSTSLLRAHTIPESVEKKSRRDYTYAEFEMLREFKRKSRNYLDDLPDDDDTIGWLALMQHYGAPTRLIDFSRSFYVACYFAMKGAEGDAAVWCVNLSWLQNSAQKSLGMEDEMMSPEQEDRMYKAANERVGEVHSESRIQDYHPPFSDIVPVDPVQRNFRLSAQQGILLLMLDVNDTLNKLFSKKDPVRDKVAYKIILNEKIHDTAIQQLREMNITSETLFPGIEGLAQSLIHKHSLVIP